MNLQTMDELKQKLLYSTFELERFKAESSEEMRKSKEYVKQLVELLKVACKERDEARDQLQKLLGTAASVVVLPATKANSGVTESNSLSETYNTQGSSPVESFLDAVSSPELLNNSTVDSSAMDQAAMAIEGLAKGKCLPQKGKLLQAVLEAGPLLQTLLVAGPLPRWRNPPQLKAFHIPPLCFEIPGPSPQMLSMPMLNFGSCLGGQRLMSAGSNMASGYTHLEKRQRIPISHHYLSVLSWSDMKTELVPYYAEHLTSGSSQSFCLHFCCVLWIDRDYTLNLNTVSSVFLQLLQLLQTMPSPSPTDSPGTDNNPPWDSSIIALVGIVGMIFLLLSYYKLLQRPCCQFRSAVSSGQMHLLDEQNREEPSSVVMSCGLESYVVHALPITPFRKGNHESSPSSSDCAVCLGEFEDGDLLKTVCAGRGTIIGWDMAELLSPLVKENRLIKGIFAVVGIMSTLVVYGLLQEKIMRVPYGPDKEYFRYSLFLVFCNRIATSAVSAAVLLGSKKALDPVAPIHKYCIISVSNILTTTCQYEALKYVSFPVQTLAKCAKMIPVMAAGDFSPYSKGRESTVWGVSLMIGYLGFDGFTSTFQDKLFKGYDMEIHTQIFYTTLCSCFLSFSGLILQGNLLMAIDFVSRHHDCFFDVLLLSTVATASQFFISFTIRNFGALTFATIMTTRQLVSILLSCMWFGHPLSWEQCVGAVIVFGSLYSKSFLRKKPKPLPIKDSENGASIPSTGNS
nr:UDP-galactose/UDP-glucose transporter 5B-like [Ipomoea batatas]